MSPVSGRVGGQVWLSQGLPRSPTYRKLDIASPCLTVTLFSGAPGLGKEQASTPLPTRGQNTAQGQFTESREKQMDRTPHLCAGGYKEVREGEQRSFQALPLG